MSKEERIIAGIFTLAGVVVGFFLQRIASWLDERKRAKKEIRELKVAILWNSSNDVLYPQLKEMKKALIRYPRAMKKPENKQFFDKWLMTTDVDGSYSSNKWDETKRQALFDDLNQTKF